MTEAQHFLRGARGGVMHGLIVSVAAIAAIVYFGNEAVGTGQIGVLSLVLTIPALYFAGLFASISHGAVPPLGMRIIAGTCVAIVTALVVNFQNGVAGEVILLTSFGWLLGWYGAAYVISEFAAQLKRGRGA